MPPFCLFRAQSTTRSAVSRRREQTPRVWRAWRLPKGSGAPGRIRTCDPRLRRPVLYPTELRAHMRWPPWYRNRPTTFLATAAAEPCQVPAAMRTARSAGPPDPDEGGSVPKNVPQVSPSVEVGIRHCCARNPQADPDHHPALRQTQTEAASSATHRRGIFPGVGRGGGELTRLRRASGTPETAPVSRA